jgi:hypothetical protein
MKPLIAAEATTFVLIQKVAKKSSQQKCFFAAQGHYPATQAKPGLGTFAAIVCAPANALQKSRYALPLRTRPSSFCLISSEAVLLTGKGKNSIMSLRMIVRQPRRMPLHNTGRMLN